MALTGMATQDAQTDPRCAPTPATLLSTGTIDGLALDSDPYAPVASTRRCDVVLELAGSA